MLCQSRTRLWERGRCPCTTHPSAWSAGIRKKAGTEAYNAACFQRSARNQGRVCNHTRAPTRERLAPSWTVPFDSTNDPSCAPARAAVVAACASIEARPYAHATACPVAHARQTARVFLLCGARARRTEWCRGAASAELHGDGGWWCERGRVVSCGVVGAEEGATAATSV
jgi:hypothetical protein